MKQKNFMGIYVHIPFCIKKCNYCDFLSFNSSEEIKLSYIDALKKEIAANSPTDKSISTIFFGGGTPSILDSKHIYGLLCELDKHYPIEKDAEITIECNPGTLNLVKLSDYKQSGINRLSIGLQSSIDDELKAIGRIHTYTQFIESYNDAISAGFSNINIDIMSALPHQTLDSYRKTLEAVTTLNLTHISAYSLILEENTPLYDLINNGNSHLLPDEDCEREMYYMTEDILKAHGFYRYEISNYAKPGYECRHNLSYWEGKEYLGLGLGASSYINGVRYKNTSLMDKYLSNSSLPKTLMEEITPLSLEDKMEEFMFLGLRKIKGISINEFYKAFGVDIFSVYGTALSKLKGDNLINIEGDTICLTPLGIDVSNTVFAEFIF